MFTFFRSFCKGGSYISIPALSLLVSIWLIVCTNTSFWKTVDQIIPFRDTTSIGFYCSLVGIYLSGSAFVFNTITVSFIGKWLVIAIVVLAGSTSFFMDNFGVHIDRNMLVNVLLTDKHEASEFFTSALLGHFLVYVILPSLFIALISIKRQSYKVEFFHRLVFSVMCLVIGIGSFGLQYKQIIAFFRTHEEAMTLLNPVNSIIAGVSQVKSQWNDRNIQLHSIGLDAKRIPHSGKPRLVVLILGETTRAANWGMNGYERNTTPVLSELEVLNFPDVSSCGTSTAVSLPCMFSMFSRSEFSAQKGKEYENLLDILSRTGIYVIWRDNDSGGSKSVADRVGEERLNKIFVEGLCNTGKGCYDSILLHDLDKRLSEAEPDQDIFLVLHQQGSHGPAYFERYPAEFKKYVPECLSTDFKQCTQEEIINSYDNTIAYIDSFLGDVIKMLKSHSEKYATAMMYVSDHGESLGEFGLYLHGIPWIIAPKEQTHIPMVVWMDEKSAGNFGIDQNRLKKLATHTYSHDNLFHSILGLMGITTFLYDENKDIFAQCKK